MGAAFPVPAKRGDYVCRVDLCAAYGWTIGEPGRGIAKSAVGGVPGRHDASRSGGGDDRAGAGDQLVRAQAGADDGRHGPRHVLLSGSVLSRGLVLCRDGSMRVLVVGGTGVVGRHVVSQMLDLGHSVAVLSRRGGTRDDRAEGFAGDLVTGSGITAALVRVQCLIDCANVATARKTAAVRYFVESTRLLGRLGAEAGVGHHVVLSIVGVDKVPFGYYVGKLAQERAALDGPVPATVLRATQFHEFAGQALQRLRLGPIGLVPAMRSQPIAAAAVATALTEIAEKPARHGRAPDIGGPAVEWMPDLARRLVRHQRRRRLVVPLPLPGATGRAMRGDGLLLDDRGVARGPSFDEWLAGRP
jgi:uncharacterized protein YbjT (DUF2867 family)